MLSVGGGRVSDCFRRIGGFIFVRCKKVVVHSKLKRENAEHLPNGTDITAKNISEKIVIYIDYGSPAEKYLRSL